MSRNIAAGNWKMNLSIDEAVMLVKALRDGVHQPNCKVILGVPFPYLDRLQNLVVGNSDIKLAAQNCHQEERGAFTGEVSVEMLRSIGIGHVILGHSERREYFDESNELLLQKTQVALEGGMHVIFCCGEPLDVRDANHQNAYVAHQLENSILTLSKEAFDNITIAYEPIWAIGTGKTATAEQAQEMHAYLRTLVRDRFGNETASNVSILYGGSVKPANAKELFSNPDVDGGLVGGASLKSDDFKAIIESF